MCVKSVIKYECLNVKYVIISLSSLHTFGFYVVCYATCPTMFSNCSVFFGCFPMLCQPLTCSSSFIVFKLNPIFHSRFFLNAGIWSKAKRGWSFCRCNTWWPWKGIGHCLKWNVFVDFVVFINCTQTNTHPNTHTIHSKSSLAWRQPIYWENCN